jgi:SAM-dependent methyltransferase
MTANTPEDLQQIYASRLAPHLEYRAAVWSVLVDDWFSRYVRPDAAVLDVGCGYGEFINAVRCRRKYGMDLNPDAARYVASDVTILSQDCSMPWPLDDGTLDVVFSSNFYEHLPGKTALGRTFDEAKRCLRPGGLFVAMGPNVKYLPGEYWDFWDHHIALTEASMREALVTRGFAVEECEARFLPYTMAHGPRYPMVFLRAYLRMRWAWRFFGKQFLVVCRRV